MEVEVEKENAARVQQQDFIMSDFGAEIKNISRSARLRTELDVSLSACKILFLCCFVNQGQNIDHRPGRLCGRPNRDDFSDGPRHRLLSNTYTI